MPINGLTETRRIPRLGKIHLGFRDPVKGYPVRTKYFVFPKDHPQYKELVNLYGPEPTELPILIPVEDSEKWYSQFYRAYSQSRGLICKGDGIEATRMVVKGTTDIPWKDEDPKRPLEVEMKTMECAGRNCPMYQMKKCGEVANLQFLLPEVPGLGVWQIDTGSINSIININSAAELIRNIYGKIAMIPLLLTLEPKETNNPETKKKQTVYVMNLRANMKLADLAQLARKQNDMLALPVGDDEAPDFANEFEALPPSTHTVQEDIDSLWGDKEPTVNNKALPVTAESAREHVAESLREPTKNKRDPATIHTIGELYQAALDDWKMQPGEVLKELNMKSRMEIVDPAESYKVLAAVR